jgi:hypothetical protein
MADSVDPTLMLVCGIDGCREYVGEVRTDGDTAIALMYCRFGERTVPYTPRVTEQSLGFAPGTVLRDATTGETLAEMQQRKFDELNAESLYFTDDGRRRAKRYTAKPMAMPLEAIGHIICPHHGIKDLSDADGTVAEIRKFATTATRPRRRYLMFRGSSLS